MHVYHACLITASDKTMCRTHYLIEEKANHSQPYARDIPCHVTSARRRSISPSMEIHIDDAEERINEEAQIPQAHKSRPLDNRRDKSNKRGYSLR